jgi:hypothetical protein
MSPVICLEAVAQGRPSVLLLDQLDALSTASGRQERLWELVDAVLAEAKHCSNMQVWLGCRTFDLQNDPRLREMAKDRDLKAVELRPLDVAEVKLQIQRAGHGDLRLLPSQLEILRVPIHLHLFLGTTSPDMSAFRSVQDLYWAFWQRTRDLVEERLGRPPAWEPIMDSLCDDLNATQSLTAKNRFYGGPYEREVKAMISLNVLVGDDKTIQFFHEGFFDYVFARRFVDRGHKLRELLTAPGEQQHLFRRSQVRQVLSYLRENDRAAYLAELAFVMDDGGVREHITGAVFDWMKELKAPTEEEARIMGLL